jgi:site-specific DNA-methyltransferase (adenine-specific)
MRKATHDPARTFWPALFSSESAEWATPPKLVAALAAEFGEFTLDPCATPETAKAPKFYTMADDGLAQPWAPARVFMNPPYGRMMGAWMRKAHVEANLGALIVCLVHARTDTRWWHEEVEPHATLVRFLRGRVSFVAPGGERCGAPFPSAVVVFTRDMRARLRGGWVKESPGGGER